MKLAGIIAVTAVVISLLAIKPKSNIFRIGPNELYFINQTRAYYPTTVGKYFQNKLHLYLGHYLQNISYGLDVNYYFFGSHPRERAGHTETKWLSSLLLPFFIFGLFRQFKNRHYEFTIYFLTALGIISIFDFDQLAFLLIPFVLFNTLWGIICTAKFLLSQRSR